MTGIDYAGNPEKKTKTGWMQDMMRECLSDEIGSPDFHCDNSLSYYFTFFQFHFSFLSRLSSFLLFDISLYVASWTGFMSALLFDEVPWMDASILKTNKEGAKIDDGS